MTQREQAERIFRAALQAADPQEAIFRHVHVEGDRLTVEGRGYDLGSFRQIWVVGAGKAGGPMAQAIEALLPGRLSGGTVNVKDAQGICLATVKLNQSSHPIPDSRGVEGAAEVARIAGQARPDDLVLALISGGASALLPLPAPPLTLEEKQATTQRLLDSGANIHEMNAVRKHLSAIKGGQLARMASQATLITLILSDVVGDDLDVIGSGPTVPDSSTFASARAVLERWGIWGKVPSSVRARLEAGVNGELLETPKFADPVFSRTQNVIVGSNRLAAEAAREAAIQMGYHTLLLSTSVEGEASEVARMHAAILKEVRTSGNPIPAPACILSGGETTVTIRGSGKGGRNQEFALSAALDIAGMPDVTILSAGTDGSDGPTDATGAFVSGETVSRAEALGLNPRQALAGNDAYPLFDRLGDLLRTGPTHTNVMDLRVMLIGQPASL